VFLHWYNNCLYECKIELRQPTRKRKDTNKKILYENINKWLLLFWNNKYPCNPLKYIQYFTSVEYSNMCCRHLNSVYIFGARIVLHYLAFTSLGFERTWWRLFQKRVVRTKFDINVFLLVHSIMIRLTFYASKR